jgi:hypothetical protein
LARLAASPWLFIFAVAIAVFIRRFFDIANLVPTYALLIPILPALQEACRINPLVRLPVFIMAVNAFFMVCRNMWAILSVSIAKDRVRTPGHQADWEWLMFSSFFEKFVCLPPGMCYNKHVATIYCRALLTL